MFSKDVRLPVHLQRAMAAEAEAAREARAKVNIMIMIMMVREISEAGVCSYFLLCVVF